MIPESTRRTLVSFDRKWKTVILLIGSSISLLGLLALIGIIGTIPGDRKRLELYRRSPGCVAGAFTSAALSPCTLLAEHLVSKRSIHHAKNADDVFLTLQNGQTAPHEIQILDYDFWFRVPAGTIVTTRTWQGHIVAVDAPGYKTMTRDNPSCIYSDDHQLVWLAGFITLFLGTLCVFGWRSLSGKAAQE